MKSHTKFAGLLLLVIALGIFFYVSGKNALQESYFVGKWKSSKLETPLYLYDNGEWEIKKDDGAVLQYGVWRYEDRKIIWSFKVDSNIIHDANSVLSYSSNEFQLEEKDGSATIFNRLP